MRVVVFIKASDESEQAVPPTPEAFEAMDKFNEELVEAGILVAAAGLKPSAAGKRIRCEGAARRIIDGPFAETRELVAGFSIWKVRDMDEAVAWASRCPNPAAGPCEIEIRPFLEAEDLADYLRSEDRAAPRKGERGRLGVA